MQYNNFQFNQKLSSSNYELGIIFFKKLYFVLGYSQLTMLFQVNSEGIQPYIYMYPFSPKLGILLRVENRKKWVRHHIYSQGACSLKTAQDTASNTTHVS